MARSAISSLQNLDFRYNELTELPPELGQLTSLQELDLSGNRFRETLPGLIAEGLDALLAYVRSLTGPPLPRRQPGWPARGSSLSRLVCHARIAG